MKQILGTIALYTVLVGGLVAGTWFGQIELLRLSIWATWMLTITSLAALCMSSREIFKEPPSKIIWKRMLYGSHLTLLIATGWIFTSIMFALAWVGLWWKRKEWEEAQSRKK